MDEKPKSRTVTPAGDTIRQLRLAKGWRVEDLARKAKCSVKTVENLEAGEQVYLCTLRSVAEAFGVEYATLLVGAVPAPATKNRLEVQIKLSIPFDVFDQSGQLVSVIEALTRLIGARKGIDVTGIEEGSVIIKLDMDANDASRLIQAFGKGKLSALDIEAVKASLALWIDRDMSKLPRAEGAPPYEGSPWMEVGDPLYQLLERLVQKTPAGE
jgi:transcriptional regulator with XRE-family HTH domain